jgi:N4-bis(aminopropyl)spermidine synthase
MTGSEKTGLTPTGFAAVAARLDEAGPFGRPLRRALRILVDDGATLAALVASTGLPRKEVERLVNTLGADARARDGLIRVDDEAYRALSPERPERPEAAGEGPGDDDQPTGDDARLREVTSLVERAPAPLRQLDHVSATAETALRRALWLAESYDLTRAHLLCVGDHDLTSLATALVEPAVEITVVDLDERILEFIDRTARERGWNIRCRWGDLRFGLPAGAAGQAHLVFTDPPYTPEGIALFLLRGLQGLADPERGRLVMAYGYGDHQPGLGLKVQEAVQSMHLVFEAILPGFNRYHGAQAIGSRSDLYVCRPTPRTWRALPRLAERADPRIYTHGDQSLEARTEAIGAAAVEALLSPVASSPDGSPVSAPPVLVGRRWSTNPTTREPEVVSVAAALRGGIAGGDAPVRVAADLADDPGPWLLRLLLAVNAARMTILIPNAHPDVATGPGLLALRELLAAKYELTVRRSTPDGRSAVVEARAVAPVDPAGSPEGMLGQYLLLRSHGKVSNVWRDALVSLDRRLGRSTTRAEARALVAAHGLSDLDVALRELPRHRVVEVLDAVRATAPAIRGRVEGPGGDT